MADKRDETIAAWLQSLDLEQYVEVFLEDAVDLMVLAEISDHDLEKMGVLLGHRRKILRAIAQDPDISARANTVRAEAPRIGEAERRHLTVL
jgi:hypothetical protein